MNRHDRCRYNRLKKVKQHIPPLLSFGNRYAFIFQLMDVTNIEIKQILIKYAENKKSKAMLTPDDDRKFYDLHRTMSQKEIAALYRIPLSRVCKAIDRHLTKLIDHHQDRYKPETHKPKNQNHDTD